MLEHKRTNEHQFEQVSQFWMGADYIEAEQKWTWTHHYQDFNNWTNWQSKVPDIGTELGQQVFFKEFLNARRQTPGVISLILQRNALIITSKRLRPQA